MKGKNMKKWGSRKWRYFLSGIWGLLAMLQAKVALADMIAANDKMAYSQTPWASWIEVVFIVIVGLMVILAVGAILFMSYQKKKDAQEKMLREEAEKEEQ